ncbi:MAG: AAA-like domain-containing protein [Vicinamibacterales bacterium]
MTDLPRPTPDFYTAGGALPLDVPTYVERDADAELFDELRHGHFCYVLTSRQMGKTSLIVRTRKRLADIGVASVAIDITAIGTNVTEEQWYTGQADEIATSLGLPDSAMEWWEQRSDLGPVQRFSRFLADQVLAAVTSDLVIFVDEIDSTLRMPFSDDYFAAIRALYNRRATDPRLGRLTFVLLGVASPADLIKDPQRTPFNIGKRIHLTDFTREEARPLLRGLAPDPDLAEKLLDRVLFWTSGHPYLSQRTCQAVAAWAQTAWDPGLVPTIVDDQVRSTFLTEERRRADSNLALVADRVASSKDGQLSPEAHGMLTVYREIVAGARVADEDLDPVRISLKLSGLVVSNAAILRVRNRIYRIVFDQAWVRAALGEPEMSPQEFAHDVFISYSARDRPFVAEFLAPRLKAARLRVASDLELVPGSNWAEALTRMRESSAFFMPILSPDWSRSRGAQEEFALQSDRVGKVVPVLLRPTRVPAFLQDIQWADFTDQAQWEESFQSLLMALGAKTVSAAKPAAPVIASAHAEVRSEAIEIATKRLTTEQLVKLASEQFPSALSAITPGMSHDAIVDLVVSDAAAKGRLEDFVSASVDASNAQSVDPPRARATGGVHAFVAMPFGLKQGIDFNRIYQELVRPALEEAGFDVFRADEELRSGNIRSDVFQELLLADLVVADLSIDDPNVWYELGVRHSLRSRGVIQIQAGRDHVPFDVYADRTLRYHVKNGLADPAHLEADRRTLTALAADAMNNRHPRKVSPVYHLLPNLQEPDWKSLRVPEATEFWAAQEEWERRIQVARRLGRPGDIMVLADEASSRALRAGAYRTAALTLRSLGKNKLALEQCECALELDPSDEQSRSLKGFLLIRLEKFDQAEAWLRDLTRDHPQRSENWGLLGRVRKEAWLRTWRQYRSDSSRAIEEAADERMLLRQAIEAYTTGFERNPSDPYPGINAVTLLYLLRHVTREVGVNTQIHLIQGGVAWAVESQLQKSPDDYWARVTKADLLLLDGTVREIETSYRDAVSVAQKDWFVLDSSRQQLQLLRDLAFRPNEVEVALKVFDRALDRLQKPEATVPPEKVILFAGHMIDRPDRPAPRFPANRERAAAEAIEHVLTSLDASPGDLALCSGANGGDLLFAEACLRRGLNLELRLPQEEARFLRESVTFAGDQWRERFYAAKLHPKTKTYLMPEELGPAPGRTNVYTRVNLWQLYTAIAWGDEKLRFVCLWDGKISDGAGGTQHMLEVARARTGRVYQIDPATLVP